ncbi:MAG TPA: tRNA (adenosine(37)-N6)-dimethylallyltransferase MiaA [Gammaproteobacteria bacterium]|nr:tRNA (adenosine(37)-N6)-dimethylallyltransferase MiaA [Gammaproteobacteria bacterium]
MSDRLPTAILLMGPTASGKSELALRLARDLPCEIVSVDSAMVYRGLDIGTAKPDPETLRRVPHRLIDIRDPSQPYSVAQFREDALSWMEKIDSAGRVPLLVGGTMLYFNALQYGISRLPAADPELRAQLDAQAARYGWHSMHARLAEVDPVSAARIHPNDPQRIQRALEVYRLTGRSLSEHHRAQRREPPPCRLLKIGVMPAGRSELHQRIERRLHVMLEQGFVDEVRGLRQRGDLGPELPAMRAVGYRQVWSYLDGECSHAEMVQGALVATRRFARRQLTWLRAEPGVRWFESGHAALYSRLRRFLADNGVRAE